MSAHISRPQFEPSSPMGTSRKVLLVLLTMLCFGYIWASQVLMDLEGWSALGVVFAILLVCLLTIGRFLKAWQLSLAGWVWIPALFLAYCGIRSLSDVGHANPLDVMSALLSAYLGGIGIAAALQAGVSFRTVAYAEVLSSLCHMAAALFGVGTEAKPGDTVARYAGLSGNANELGLQLTLGACLIWLFPKKSGFIPCAFAFMAVAYAVATTGSRQALMATALFLTIFLLQTWSALKRRPAVLAFALALVVVLVGVLGFVMLGDTRDETAVQRAIGYSSDHSYQKRIVLIEQGLRLWAQAPILGNGLDSFRALSGQGTYAHNNYVELLADGGVIAALLFYAMHPFILGYAFRLPGPLRLCCILFVLVLLALDMGSVGYKRKQTVMVLMLLMSLASTARSTVKSDTALKVGKRFSFDWLKVKPAFTLLPSGSEAGWSPEKEAVVRKVNR